MSDFPAARRIRLPDRVTAAGVREPGITLSVHEAGRGPAVVLCHGFPELAYSWRHQIPAIADAGFRAIAPDQRGFGGSDAPESIEAYGMEQLTGDLAGLLEAVGVERAIFVGHDWGGFVAWAMPVLHPGVTAGVIGVNTPYIPFPTTEFLRQLFEKQTIRRMEQGTLTAEETEKLGVALMRLEETVRDLAGRFGLSPEELNLDLGPLGRLR